MYAPRWNLPSKNQWELDVPLEELRRIRSFWGSRDKFFGELKDKVLWIYDKICMVASFDSSSSGSLDTVKSLDHSRDLFQIFEYRQAQNDNEHQPPLSVTLWEASDEIESEFRTNRDCLSLVLEWLDLESSERPEAPLTLCFGSLQPSRWSSAPPHLQHICQQQFMIAKTGHEFLALREYQEEVGYKQPETLVLLERSDSSRLDEIMERFHSCDRIKCLKVIYPPRAQYHHDGDVSFFQNVAAMKRLRELYFVDAGHRNSSSCWRAWWHQVIADHPSLTRVSADVAHSCFGPSYIHERVCKERTQEVALALNKGNHSITEITIPTRIVDQQVWREQVLPLLERNRSECESDVIPN